MDIYPITKICTKCKQLKPLDKFYEDTRYLDGRKRSCKACGSARRKTTKYVDHKKYYDKQYHSTSSKYKEYHKKYMKTYLSNNLNAKLGLYLRNRLNAALHGNFKAGSAVKDCGCTMDFLKEHLESLWQPGMTWENWTTTGWHIDHKIPLVSFNLTDRDQFLIANHYTNLQPLWAKDNWNKGSKILNKQE